jgi:hypothetical protein
VAVLFHHCRQPPDESALVGLNQGPPPTIRKNPKRCPSMIMHTVNLACSEYGIIIDWRLFAA